MLQPSCALNISERAEICKRDPNSNHNLLCIAKNGQEIHKPLLIWSPVKLVKMERENEVWNQSGLLCKVGGPHRDFLHSSERANHNVDWKWQWCWYSSLTIMMCQCRGSATTNENGTLRGYICVQLLQYKESYGLLALPCIIALHDK